MCHDDLPDSRLSQDAGFTLVELLITVVVLIVGIVSVAQLVPVSIGSNLRNRNDSTALIAAQALVEQMNQQQMRVTLGVACANNPQPPAGHYAFCDQNGYGIALGLITAAPGPDNQGCTLNAAGQIDFTQAAATCNGYQQTENGIDLRWNVTTLHGPSGFPFRKVFIVAGRQGGATFSNVTANLMSVASN